MINVLKKENWSNAFLLPLTGIKRDTKFSKETHLFWNEYSINDYKLMLTLTYEDKRDFLEYCRGYMFPVMDKKGYLLESYDFKDKSIFVLDMSEWAKDIEMFIVGKYSKFSEEAKKIIKKYHITVGKEVDIIPIHILAALYPNDYMEALNTTPIEYVAAEYDLDLHDLKRVGEIGSIFTKDKETLQIN